MHLFSLYISRRLPYFHLLFRSEVCRRAFSRHLCVCCFADSKVSVSLPGEGCVNGECVSFTVNSNPGWSVSVAEIVRLDKDRIQDKSKQTHTVQRDIHTRRGASHPDTDLCFPLNLPQTEQKKRLCFYRVHFTS